METKHDPRFTTPTPISTKLEGIVPQDLKQQFTIKKIKIGEANENIQKKTTFLNSKRGKNGNFMEDTTQKVN